MFLCSVIRTTFFEGYRVAEWYTAGIAYQLFLCALLTLHVFWFVLILRIALQKLLTGTVRLVLF